MASPAPRSNNRPRMPPPASLAGGPEAAGANQPDART